MSNHRVGWYALLCGALHTNTQLPAIASILLSFCAAVICWNVPSYFFIRWRRDRTALKKVLPTTVDNTNMAEHKKEEKEEAA